MDNKECLQMYIDLVPFLAAVCGPESEIVLHDLENPDHSIVAIENAITGRKVGDPLTDYARERAIGSENSNIRFLSNYNSEKNQRTFISSTYFIKNDDNLIGMLCINKNTAASANVQTAITTLFKSFNLMPVEENVRETMDTPITEIVHNRITECIKRSNYTPSRMSIAEKVQIVHELNEAGLLDIKGAVNDLAEQLDVSVPTIYRYIKKM